MKPINFNHWSSLRQPDVDDGLSGCRINEISRIQELNLCHRLYTVR